MIPVAAARTFLIHLTLPIPPLLLNIFLIVKTPPFKEGRLYEAHQVLDTAFFLGAILPAQLQPTPISSVAYANTGFHSVTSPLLRHFRAIVFGRSNTHSKGRPPQLAKCSARVRTKLSTVSSFTKLTRMKREYFRREAKKWDPLAGAIADLHFHFSKLQYPTLSTPHNIESGKHY